MVGHRRNLLGYLKKKDINSTKNVCYVCVVIAFICFPLGQFILPESLLATQVATLGLGLAGGILLAECILLVPAINKLRKKMGELIKKAI